MSGSVSALGSATVERSGLGVVVSVQPPCGGRGLISIVAPFYNEEDGVDEFHTRVTDALEGEELELVMVDDGSTDATRAALTALALRDPRVRPVYLARNFGHQAALTAGLDHARGAAVVMIDGDLQDPPDVIPRMLEAWRAGAQVVHGVRHVRPGEPRVRLWAIRAFYRVFARVTNLESFPGNSGDFRLVSRAVLDVLEAVPERGRFLRGLVSWVGLRQEQVLYEREERFAGRSKYPLGRLIRLAGDGIVAFSSVPLRFATVVGAFCAVAAFLAIPLIIVLKVAGLYDASGIASVHVLVLLIGGLQMCFLGLIGEYLGRTFDEAKRRPVYVAEAQPATAASTQARD